jgi:IS30 family transposase
MLKMRHDRHVFWSGVASGLSTQAAADAAGLTLTSAYVWLRQSGGVIPEHLVQPLSGRYLGPIDRAAIMVADRQGQSVRAIAAMLGRAPSTISRELRRNRRHWMPRYHAGQAQLWAESRALRPQSTKMASNPVLREFVQTRLDWKWSPEQISNQLKLDFPAEEVMRVSPETIYRSIFVQARGSLKREVEVKLRTGRVIRKSRKQVAGDARRKPHIRGMVMISERPAEVEDRAVPGHWEGDLIVGSRNQSQIGTLVERSTRYCMLVHLPGSREADVVADALTSTIKTLPGELMKSLTWDQGGEMANHQTVTLATDTAIYFCDPRSPWQRGTNENTNGLLRQYFPKGTDLSQHTPEHLAFVARELNGRPRKTLGWKSPAQAFEELLLATQQQTGVATTT